MLKGFKEFIARGNVVDLAVGVVIGAAFGKVTTALVEKFLNPLIGGLVGEPNFDSFLQFHLGQALVQPGAILTALANFLLVAAALYFFVVYPMNRWHQRIERERALAQPAADEPVDPQIELLTQIRDHLASAAVEGVSAPSEASLAAAGGAAAEGAAAEPEGVPATLQGAAAAAANSSPTKETNQDA